MRRLMLATAIGAATTLIAALPAAACPGDSSFPLLGGHPPTIENLAPTQVTPTTASFAAGLDPWNLTTTYHLEYGVAAYDHRAPDVVLPDCRDAPIDPQLTALSPATRYMVRLVAANAAGTTTALSTVETESAPVPSPQGVSLTSIKAVTAPVGEAHFRLTGRIHGNVDPKGFVYVLESTADQPDYRIAPGGPRAHPSADGRFTVGAIALRNTRFRVRYEGVESNPASAVVYPETQLHAERNDLVSVRVGKVVFLYTAGVVYRPRRLRTQRAYFYYRTSRSALFVRFKSRRLALVTDDLVAETTLAERRAGQAFACVKHSIDPQMGRPFRNRLCGRRRFSGKAAKQMREGALVSFPRDPPG